jgi:hypothetical protein
VEPTDILLIRSDFEVVVVAGYAFFWKKATFERAFGFLDQLKAESLETFNSVTTSLRSTALTSCARRAPRSRR